MTHQDETEIRYVVLILILKPSEKFEHQEVNET